MDTNSTHWYNEGGKAILMETTHTVGVTFLIYCKVLARTPREKSMPATSKTPLVVLP